MADIHPLASVAPGANLGRDVSVGPFAVIEEGVQIGDRCRIAARATVKSGTTLGEENSIYEGAVVGGAPQHLQPPAQQGTLVIGNGNVIRENATIHRAMNEGGSTIIGNNNFFMVNSHIAHDCVLGNHLIVANNVMLAGHITVGDRAYLSGGAAVHQFCRIGPYAMVGGQSHITQDVPPFVTVDGWSSKVVGLNLIGLRRAGFTSEQISELKSAYRVIYRSGLTWSEVKIRLAEEFNSGPAAEFAHFLTTGGDRGFVHERRTPRDATVKFRVLHGDEMKNGDALTDEDDDTNGDTERRTA